MMRRIISSLAGIGVFLLICFGGHWFWPVGVTMFTLLCAREWIAVYQNCNGPAGRILNPLLTVAGACYPLALAVALGEAGRPQYPDALLAAAPIALFLLLLARYARGGPALGGLRGKNGAIAFIYIGIPLSSLILLHKLGKPGEGPWLTLGVLACVWAADTTAFLIGRKWGKNHFAPRLSPGKTTEGLIAGILGALAAGLLFGVLIGSPLAGMAAGAIAGGMAPLGDLWESALKREQNCKDFGTLMPGHGGMMDRLDSLIFVAPLATLALMALLAH